MESIKELRKICRVEEGNNITAKIFRFFSIYLTWFFLHFKKITANQITVGGSALFVISSFAYIKGEYWLNLIGIFLLFLGNTLDYVDGEVARYRRRVSPIGGYYLDPMTHDVKYGFLFIALALGEYSSFPYPGWLIFLGFAASMSMVLFRLAKLRYIQIIFGYHFQSEESYREIGKNTFYSNNKLKGILGYLGGTSDILILLLLATILDKVYLAVIFYGILFPLIYLALLFKQYRGIKNIKT